MKIKKFLRSLSYVVFVILLLFVSIVPIFAIEFYVGGGGGTTTRPLPLQIPRFTTNLHIYGLDSEVTTTPYFSSTFDPLFVNSLDLGFNYSFSDTNLVSLPLGHDQSFIDSSTQVDYFNYSGDYDYMHGGSLSCDFAFVGDIFHHDVSAFSFTCDSFYAWSESIDGVNSQFRFDISMTDASIDPFDLNPPYYIYFEYLELGSFFDHGDYQYVQLPLDYFYDAENDLYRITLDHYFNELSPGQVYYHVRDFSVVIPNSDTSCYFSGDISCYVNPYVLDLDNLYPVASEQIDLHDYTDWIATSVRGFLSLEIFPGFYLSGFLIVILGFSMFVWALKVFAGG